MRHRSSHQRAPRLVAFLALAALLPALGAASPAGAAGVHAWDGAGTAAELDACRKPRAKTADPNGDLTTSNHRTGSECLQSRYISRAIAALSMTRSRVGG